MNTKNNKRRRESVEKIKKAFFILLENQELNSIKVSEICKLANINRSTFYANYVDIYDLAEKIYHDLKNEVDQLFDLGSDIDKYESEFLQLLTHIKDHQSLYNSYFKLGYEGRITRAKSFFEIKETNMDRFMHYHIEFFKNGFNSIVKMWLDNGCKESPREMCDILLYEYRGRF